VRDSKNEARNAAQPVTVVQASGARQYCARQPPSPITTYVTLPVPRIAYPGTLTGRPELAQHGHGVCGAHNGPMRALGPKQTLLFSFTWRERVNGHATARMNAATSRRSHIPSLVAHRCHQWRQEVGRPVTSDQRAGTGGVPPHGNDMSNCRTYGIPSPARPSPPVLVTCIERRES
jgi:hypothetical protein